MTSSMDIDDLKYMRGLVVAGDKDKLLVILDAAIEDLEDEDEDDGEQTVDGHPACECGRVEHLCKTFNDPDADHGDA